MNLVLDLSLIDILERLSWPFHGLDQHVIPDGNYEVLLNNFRPEKDDRFYFLFRFAVRSWLLFLCVIFFVPIGNVFGRSITGNQFLTMCGAFALMVAVDFISV